MRRRDYAIDEKIGVTIRIHRMRLKLTKAELGEALGVTFQQVHKYETGTNSVASTRIGDLCTALQITPNELFGETAARAGEAMQFGPQDIKMVLKLRCTSPGVRRALDALLATMTDKPDYAVSDSKPRQQTPSAIGNRER
jgi:transcriptional regulator with XRE-family HTH domain